MREWDFVRSVMPDLEAEGPTIELVRDTRGVWRAPGDVRDADHSNRQESRSASADPPSPGPRLWSGIKQSVGTDGLRAALQVLKDRVRDWKGTWLPPTQQAA
jgi:hypothetical protein